MRGYLKTGVAAAIREAGGAIFAVTSEPQTLADEARTSWELDFPAVGDPHHEIVDTCRQRGWLSLFVNPDVGLLEESTGWAAHPNGYLQPGVLALSAEGRVLYRWRGRPTRQNIGGATSRPLPEDIWAKIGTARAAPADDAEDAALDEPENVDQKGAPWPLFVMLLLANGWFIRPKPFDLARGGPDYTAKRLARALLRLALFVAAWIAAFATLPLFIAGFALVAWTLWIVPGVRRVNREFQSIPTGEPAGG